MQNCQDGRCVSIIMWSIYITYKLLYFRVQLSCGKQSTVVAHDQTTPSASHIPQLPQPTISDDKVAEECQVSRILYGERRTSLFPQHIKYVGLKKVLDADIVGRALLSIYEKEGEFDSVCQGYLCTIIITHFLNIDSNMYVYTYKNCVYRCK